MKTPTFVLTALAVAALATAACKKNQDQPPMQPYNQYPTATAPAPTAPVGGQPPAALSPACQQLEGTCGFARCNMQAGRCAFPCNGPQDCIQGSQCLGAGTPVAVCAPMAIPGMTPAPAPTQ